MNATSGLNSVLEAKAALLPFALSKWSKDSVPYAVSTLAWPFPVCHCGAVTSGFVDDIATPK